MDLSSTQRKVIAVVVAGSLHLAVAVPLTQLRIAPPQPVPVMVGILPTAPTPIPPAAPMVAAPPPAAPPAASPVIPPVAVSTQPTPAPVSVVETSAAAAPQSVAAGPPAVQSSAVAASAAMDQSPVAQTAAHPGNPAAPVVERIEPPGFQAAYLDNPQPPYPLLSRRNREAGQVRLRVLVSADGRAESLKIQVSSGYPRLDMAASEAVRGWRFTPARQAGRNIAGWVEVPITFSLEN
jgi:periplasmic protein TonB